MNYRTVVRSHSRGRHDARAQASPDRHEPSDHTDHTGDPPPGSIGVRAARSSRQRSGDSEAADCLLSLTRAQRCRVPGGPEPATLSEAQPRWCRTGSTFRTLAPILVTGPMRRAGGGTLPDRAPLRGTGSSGAITNVGRGGANTRFSPTGVMGPSLARRSSTVSTAPAAPGSAGARQDRSG